MKITYLSQVSVLALAVGAWGFLGLATVEIAHAQDGAPPVTGEETTVGEDQTISLEETSAPVGGETELEAVTIEVTARREAEDLLNVPASVAVDQNPSESIQNPSEGAAEVGRRVPNYSVNDVGTPTQTFGAVRGVGTLGFPLNAFDTTITYAVNGLPISLLAGSHQLLDLERVEVLRGPQNVLFGRSSQGGTINYVTRKPDGERDIRVRGEIGTDGEFLTDVILGGTIIEDRLNGRGSFRFTGGDGFVQNIPTGETLPDRQILGGRGALRAFLTNRTTLDVSGYFEQDERETFSSFILPDGPDFPASSVVPPQTSDRDLFIGDAVLRHEFNKFDLTTSFGYQRINFESVSDSTDGLIFSELTGAPSFFFDTPGTDEGILAQEERTFFGEIRATSSPDADTRWIMGVGVYRSNFDSMVTGVNSFGAPIPNGVNDTDLTLTDVSGFGEVSLNVTDRLTFTPGIRIGRLTFDRTDEFTSNGAPGILPSFSDSGTFEDFYAAGGVSLDYRITDRTTVYTSAKTGYAGGGFQDFNAQAPFGIPQPSFPSSTSQSFELGAKGLFLDDKLFLNGAAFFNRIENGHTQVFDSATFSFFVEPLDYTTFGFEAEAQYQINDYWQVFGAVGLTESRFFDVEPGVPSGAINGNPLPNVPMWQANFRAVNTLPLDDIGLKGNIVTTGEIQFVDERPADIANSFTLDSYVVVNAQIGWENENFKFYAFGRNLTDTNIQVFGEQFAADPVAGPFVNAVTLQSTDRIVGFGGEIRF